MKTLAADGVTVRAMDVRLLDGGGQVLRKGSTGVSTPTFQFNYLPPGDYDLRGYDGAVLVARRTVTLSASPEVQEVQLLSLNGVPASVEAPNHVELPITHTEPGLRGDTAQGGTKQATLETGVSIMVPLFIVEGERVRVDTRTGGYITRV